MIVRMRTMAISLALVAASGGLVTAEGIDPEGPLTAPGFSTIDRPDATSRAGLELSYLMPDDDVVGDPVSWRLDLHGQYVSKTLGVGGYLSVPISYGSFDIPVFGEQSATAIGDVEVGAMYVRQLGAQAGIVLRGGLMLPTAGDEGDETLASATARLSRITDSPMAIPEGTTLRLAVSPMFRSGNVYGRIDAGIDINVSNANDVDYDPALRLNAALGVLAANTFALSGELSLYAPTDDNADSLTNFAIAGRYAKGNVNPYLAIVIPLDDDVSDAMDFALTVGLDAKL
jgi:hypothetical protein